MKILRHTRPLLSGLFLLSTLLCYDVSGQRSRTSRRSQRRPSSRAPGPNMCKVQHVLGTKERFFSYCLSTHVKVICERPTYERWECCSGFVKKGRRDKGCTAEKPLGDVMTTSRELDLDTFEQLALDTGLDHILAQPAAHTAFVPTDQAFSEISPKAQIMLTPEDSSAPLLHYHIAPGRLNVTSFRKKNQLFTTLYKGWKIRVNKYAFGVATVNCARIIKPDVKATNGIVHVIDKVLNPLDVSGTLAERIMSDSRFSQFQLALFVSDMVRRLKAQGASFTVLAPTNQAFAKLPNDILDRILTDADTAEKVIKRHVVRGVFCADAIVVAVGLKTLDDSRLLFRCKRDGLRINEARVLHPDLVASNGVIHGIDTVLLPDLVKSTSDLLYDMRLDRFLDLAREAGLNNTLDDQDITIFSPTDKAIRDLPPGYLAALREEPLKMKDLITHHIVKGKLSDDSLVGDSTLETLSELGMRLKVNVLRNGVVLDKSSLSPYPRECKNAMIHRVDRVLIPPSQDLMAALTEDSELSMFVKMMEATNMSKLLVPGGSYTVLAPTNQALARLEQRQLGDLMKAPDRLLQFVKRHVVLRMVLKCSVPEDGIYTIKSAQGDETEFSYDWKDRLIINTHSRVVTDDIMTKNGILYKIDHVIPCSCERSMRTKAGRYITGHRYRRRY